MRETTNTNQERQLKPEGTYTLTVSEVPEKRRAGNSTFRLWRFNYIEGENLKKITILLWPWESRDLLVALGGTDLGGGNVDWDDEEIVGKTVKAELFHEKGNDGKTREKLRNISPAETPVVASVDDTWLEEEPTQQDPK